MKNFFAKAKRVFFPPIPICEIGEGTVLMPAFTTEMRVNILPSRICIGKNSMVDCKIVLERETGNVLIGDNTYIGTSTIITTERVTIGSDVLISWGVTIVDHDSHSIDWEHRKKDVPVAYAGYIQGGWQEASARKDWNAVNKAKITISDKVWIGFNSIILKGVTIGEGSIVAAGSIVTRDVDPWTIVGGNPAKFIKNAPHLGK